MLLQPVHPDALQLALLALQTAVLAHPSPGEQPHDVQVDGAQRRQRQRQRRVVQEQEQQEHAAGDQLDDHPNELLGRHGGDLVDQLDPGGQVAAVAVGEESHPQTEQPPDEAVCVVHREPHCQEPEAALPQPGQQVYQAARQGHPARQRNSPLRLPSAPGPGRRRRSAGKAGRRPGVTAAARSTARTPAARSRPRARATACGRRRGGSRRDGSPVPASKLSATPVNPWSNSSALSVRWPLAGSFTR